ncbi:hypothetical protein ACFXPR_35725 [Nocardia tengchongensis]|uniref:hypothetical protein n=1 Tax=Nocardia tengchongensis TaxID=2055889 RepID=UPI0036A2F9DD
MTSNFTPIMGILLLRQLGFSLSKVGLPDREEAESTRETGRADATTISEKTCREQAKRATATPSAATHNVLVVRNIDRQEPPSHDRNLLWHRGAENRRADPGEHTGGPVTVLITTCASAGAGAGTLAGLVWWVYADGPARLFAGLFAVLHPDEKRRKDARAVLTNTKRHRRGR